MFQFLGECSREILIVSAFESLLKLGLKILEVIQELPSSRELARRLTLQPNNILLSGSWEAEISTYDLSVARRISGQNLSECFFYLIGKIHIIFPLPS
jgi:hypothetical protein